MVSLIICFLFNCRSPSCTKNQCCQKHSSLVLGKKIFFFVCFEDQHFENPQGELCDRWKLNWTHEIKKNLDRISSWSSSSRGGEEQRDSFSFVFVGWVTFFFTNLCFNFPNGTTGKQRVIRRVSNLWKSCCGYNYEGCSKSYSCYQRCCRFAPLVLAFFSSCFLSLLRFAYLLLSLFLFVFLTFFGVFGNGKRISWKVFLGKEIGCGECEERWWKYWKLKKK